MLLGARSMRRFLTLLSAIVMVVAIVAGPMAHRAGAQAASPPSRSSWAWCSKMT